jgi:hypothetical protein
MLASTTPGARKLSSILRFLKKLTPLTSYSECLVRPFGRHRPLQDFLQALIDPHSPKRLRLLIPPTLVQGDADRLVYFTDHVTGYVKRLKSEEIDEGLFRKMFLDGKGEQGTEEVTVCVCSFTFSL